MRLGIYSFFRQGFSLDRCLKPCKKIKETVTKYDYLILKKELIVRNFDFMKNGMLDELVETKDILNTL